MQGIISRIPYLTALSVDAVWLSPFYPSPLKDGGCESHMLAATVRAPLTSSGSCVAGMHELSAWEMICRQVECTAEPTTYTSSLRHRIRFRAHVVNHPRAFLTYSLV